MELTPAEKRARALKRLEDAKRQMQAKLAAAAAKSAAPGAGGDGSRGQAAAAAPVAKHSRDAQQPARAAAPASRLFAKPFIEYDFSTMRDSKGGFISADDAPARDAAQDHAAWLESQSNLQPPFPFDDPRAPSCVVCGQKELDFRLWRVFHVGVCKDCRRAHPERFALLTKTECRQDYLLTEPELRDAELLPHMERPNPYQSTYSNMMLYMRCQVEDFAVKKWGSLDALDAEYERREALKKDRKQVKFEKRLRDMRNKTRAQAITGLGKAQKHVHIWGPPRDDAEGGIERMCSVCGTVRHELKV